MAELRVLRLFGNPLEFLPEILPLRKLRHLTLANIRVVADEKLRSVNVEIEVIFLQLPRLIPGSDNILLITFNVFQSNMFFPCHCRWKTVLIL